jgi:hypothetical protein
VLEDELDADEDELVKRRQMDGNTTLLAINRAVVVYKMVRRVRLTEAIRMISSLICLASSARRVNSTAGIT